MTVPVTTECRHISVNACLKIRTTVQKPAHRRNDIIELKSIRETDRKGQSEGSVYDDQIGLRELAMLRFQSLSTRTGSTCL